MPLAAQIRTSTESGKARGSVRRTLRLKVAAATPEDASHALIHNISEGGLLVETRAPLKLGDTLEVDLPEAGTTAAIVVWSRDRFFGCRFQSPVHVGAVSAALLRSPARPRADSGEAPFPFSRRHYEPVKEAEDPWMQVLVIAGIIVSLLAAVIFAVALLSYPFSLQ